MAPTKTTMSLSSGIVGRNLESFMGAASKLRAVAVLNDVFEVSGDGSLTDFMGVEGEMVGDRVLRIEA
jgi:hypothetical protein